MCYNILLIPRRSSLVPVQHIIRIPFFVFLITRHSRLQFAFWGSKHKVWLCYYVTLCSNHDDLKPDIDVESIFFRPMLKEMVPLLFALTSNAKPSKN